METLAGERIPRQSAVRPLDVPGQIPSGIGRQSTQQHAGQADGVRFGLQFLPVRHEDRRHLEATAVVGHVAHGVREEAARATGGVIQRADQAGIGLEQLIVRIEQQRGREMHHVARRHEVFGTLVHFRAEAPDQVLVEVAHLPVGNLIGVQINASEVVADLVEQTRLVQADEGVREVELLEDDASVVREPRHVVLQVLPRLGAAERCE